MNHLTIFDALYPKFKIDKPIRLITLFSGYDSQALALKYLDVPFQHYRTCEWAVKSIQALKDLHFKDVNVECDLSKEELVEELFDLGISSNYNEPMTRKQIERLSLDQLTKIWKNIKETNNMVNIQKATANTLGITNTDIYIYILTYSFPCQDLSLAGKGKGMSDTSTRSGMLWEVERLLNECKEKPQVLLMENVPMIHSEENIEDFNKWKSRLEEMGYKNYFQDLIATDYGIPQIRNRCFMISILGDYSYTFPTPIPLKLKLKDMLEDNVDEKYFLTNKMLKGMLSSKFHQYQLENRLQDIESNVDTLTTATEGDGINISSRMKYQRGNVQKDKIQTLDTYGGMNKGVVVRDNYIQWKQKGRLDIDTRAYFEDKVAPTTTTTPKTKIIQGDLKIRRLTPKECFRLMGVKDEDYEKIKVNQSDSSLYHLAGDSIVVNVLMAIFKELY